MSNLPFTASPKFWEFNPWEPSVLMAVRDVCRYGDVAFDIGVHSAGVAVEMSRAVGPRGAVCAFEASLENVKRSHENIVAAHAANVQLYHNAVHSKSGEIVRLYERAGGNDSLYYVDANAPFQSVPTISIDDFVDESGLIPQVIKIDIEGGEHDAVVGATRTISKHAPILIVEQTCNDLSCYNILTGRGYKAVDLGTYTMMPSEESYSNNAGMTNVIYIPGHMDSPYLSAEKNLIAELGASDFEVSGRGVEIKTPLELPAGRYLCIADFSATENNNDAIAGVEDEAGFSCLYYASTYRLAIGSRDWCFNVPYNTKIKPYLRFIGGSDETLRWNGVKIYEYPAFAKRLSRLR